MDDENFAELLLIELDGLSYVHFKFIRQYATTHTSSFTIVLSITVPLIQDRVCEIVKLWLALGRMVYFGC